MTNAINANDLAIRCRSSRRHSIAGCSRCGHISTDAYNGSQWAACSLSCIDCSFEREQARAKAAAEREARKAAAEARRRASLQPTEKRIRARFAGRCSRCAESVDAGDAIAFDTDTRTVRHIDCAPAPARELAPGERTCALCGDVIRHGMTSPRGVVCPDCYDLAEEGR